jgi:uncharacterized protein
LDLIITHKSCPDGFVAGYIAQKKYPEAKIMYCDHGLEPPYEEATGKDVLVFDFSWRTREQNDKMASLAKSFHIYDHHKSAQEVLAGAPYATLDIKRSGAGLAWDYLFGKEVPYSDFDVLHDFGRRPWFVDYVEDRDLWNWKLPRSKEVCAYLGTLEFTKEAWDGLRFCDPTSAAELGVGALAHIDHYVREAVQESRVGLLFGYVVAVLNVPYLNCSEIGNELAKTHDISLTWFERGDGVIQFSLRSIGDKDVSEVAKKFNGGGHRNASGFQLPLLEGRALIDQILGRLNVTQRS